MELNTRIAGAAFHPMTALNAWEHFKHGADIGVRGIGVSRDAAFEQAALALSAVVADLATIGSDIPIRIRCEAPDDDELLLVDWLNALIYEMATRSMLFSRFSVTIRERVLDAIAWGESLDRARHHPSVEVKGATYSELRVEHSGDCWVAQCVVDV